MTLAALRRDLRAVATPEHAAVALSFFKTGKGQYGEGDRFLGIRVPQLREVVRHHSDLPLSDVEQLLDAAWHEERLAALLIISSAPQIMGAYPESRDRAPLYALARSESLWERRIAAAAEEFPERHAPRMPRTMLRYAIEKFPEPLRRRYLDAR